ncbi:ORF112 [Ranid herpesvirus 2]|uniref:ORF112 n=1 Tax=Ranid herpesvirus 2 TaxID=389214 RepID=Q14VZ4_9VIRU|nr:ORF112 [Ranid herpesvirus 2]ABG25613.1 ORF112 [Ranid herpesvirus 2]
MSEIPPLPILELNFYGNLTMVAEPEHISGHTPVRCASSSTPQQSTFTATLSLPPNVTEVVCLQSLEVKAFDQSGDLPGFVYLHKTGVPISSPNLYFCDGYHYEPHLMSGLAVGATFSANPQDKKLNAAQGHLNNGNVFRYLERPFTVYDANAIRFVHTLLGPTLPDVQKSLNSLEMEHSVMCTLPCCRSNTMPFTIRKSPDGQFMAVQICPITQNSSLEEVMVDAAYHTDNPLYTFFIELWLAVMAPLKAILCEETAELMSRNHISAERLCGQGVMTSQNPAVITSMVNLGHYQAYKHEWLVSVESVKKLITCLLKLHERSSHFFAGNSNKLTLVVVTETSTLSPSFLAKLQFYALNTQDRDALADFVMACSPGLEDNKTQENFNTIFFNQEFDFKHDMRLNSAVAQMSLRNYQ